MDASKAFDMILHDGLYLKLVERGALLSFICILRATAMVCSVLGWLCGI